MRKWILSAIVLLAAFAGVGFVGFVLAIILVGPHSDVLPGFMRVPVGLLIWAGVIGLPSWLSYKTYIKCRAKEAEE